MGHFSIEEIRVAFKLASSTRDPMAIHVWKKVAMFTEAEMHHLLLPNPTPVKYKHGNAHKKQTYGIKKKTKSNAHRLQLRDFFPIMAYLLTA